MGVRSPKEVNEALQRCSVDETSAECKGKGVYDQQVGRDEVGLKDRRC